MLPDAIETISTSLDEANKYTDLVAPAYKAAADTLLNVNGFLISSTLVSIAISPSDGDATFYRVGLFIQLVSFGFFAMAIIASFRLRLNTVHAAVLLQAYNYAGSFPDTDDSPAAIYARNCTSAINKGLRYLLILYYCCITLTYTGLMLLFSSLVLFALLRIGPVVGIEAVGLSKAIVVIIAVQATLTATWWGVTQVLRSSFLGLTEEESNALAQFYEQRKQRIRLSLRS